MRRAIARSGLVDRRARPGGDPLLPPRFRDGARAVRPHHRAEPAFRAGLLDARRDPGAAQGLRRVGGGVSARRPPVAADAADARRRSAARSRCRARASRRSRCCSKLEAYAKERYVSPLEFAWIQFALGDVDLGFHWLAKACEDRSFDLISIKVDPRFDALRDDPPVRSDCPAHGRQRLLSLSLPPVVTRYFERARRQVGVAQPETPFQRLEIHLVDIRVVPGGGGVTQRRDKTRPLP